mmetsp:Transcript_26307/g.43665  ORF Transcript_26307/g.43665 Transcript_26307/m.43665 type:complete len:200 (+) Transcript_26307:174-773(+)
MSSPSAWYPTLRTSPQNPNLRDGSTRAWDSFLHVHRKLELERTERPAAMCRWIANVSFVAILRTHETTRPAGPVPVLVRRGRKPNSSTGMPNSVSLDSYTRITSLCALVTRESSYCKSLIAEFFESRTSSSFFDTVPSIFGSRLAAASTSESCASFFSRLSLMACSLRSKRMFLKPDFCCTSYIVDSNLSYNSSRSFST